MQPSDLITSNALEKKKVFKVVARRLGGLAVYLECGHPMKLTSDPTVITLFGRTFECVFCAKRDDAFESGLKVGAEIGQTFKGMELDETKIYIKGKVESLETPYRGRAKKIYSRGAFYGFWKMLRARVENRELSLPFELQIPSEH